MTADIQYIFLSEDGSISQINNFDENVEDNVHTYEDDASDYSGNFYDRNFRQLPLLTVEEESEYTKALVHGTKAEQKHAADELIIHNMRYVLKLASNFTGYGVSYDDLVQFGAMGLMRATQKFDYTFGNRFTTYATYWIKQSIMRGINETGRNVCLPNYIYERLRQINTVESELDKEKLTKKECMQKLSEKTGYSEKYIEHIKNITSPVMSLDKPFQPDGVDQKGTLQDTIPNNVSGSVEDLYEIKWLVAPLHNLMRERLTPKEYDIVCCRFGLLDDTPKSLQAVADVKGISKERVKQLVDKALSKLKHSKAKRIFKEYIT